jgi:uncharacterized protein YndB with AHSA1/START domain
VNVDIAHHIRATTREVLRRDHEGSPAWVLLASRTYDTEIADLWDALTSATRIPRWFMPISGELRLGGRYQLHGNASGQITRCEPPRALEVTWEFGGQVSWVKVTLTPEGDRATRLVLEHVAHVPDTTWAQYGPGAAGVGWDASLMGLALHLASGAGVDHAEVEAWSASDEGKAFFGQASTAWSTAAVQAGTDPEAARAAAERTTAFYTGAPG